MSDKESKKILESINDAFPKMSDFDKGYFLGVAETAARKEESKEENKAAG